MTTPETTAIYTLLDTELVNDARAVTLDDPEAFASGDISVPIHVTAGLHQSDVAVFFDTPLAYDSDEDSVGFFVAKADADGSGILILGDSLEEQPKLWLNETLITTWSYLYEQEYSFADFNLGVLDAFFRELIRKRVA